MKIFYAICLSLLTSDLLAKNLYVDIANNSCNDSTSYASNTANLPWCSLGRAAWGSTNRAAPSAAQAAQAGDTVFVAAGTYSTNAVTNLRYDPLYNPVNNGSAGLPITIQAAGNVYLQATAGAQPIIGTYQKSYIVWDGFILNEATIPIRADTGPLVVWSSDHVTIQNMHITGINPGYIDNHNGIRLEVTSDITIRNNRIQGYNAASIGENDACLMAYDSNNVLIEHNECSEAGAGFFVKGDHPGDSMPLQTFTIRYNYIHNTRGAIQFGGIIGDAACSNSSLVYQNLITNSSLGGVVFIGYDNTTPACVTVANNTLVDIGEPNANSEAGGILLRPGYDGYRGLRFHNNLITDSSSGVAAWDVAFNATPTDTSFSHNNYYNNYTVAFVAYNARTLSLWQTTFGKDTIGTTTLNPVYMGASDFRLNTATSPLINAGLDVLDLDNDGSTNDAITIGAYLTGNEVMGLTSGLPAPPRPPVNVTIQINN